MNCFFCKGETVNKLSSFMIDINGAIIVIKNVPSNVCEQCGEISYSFEVSKKLEGILDKIEPLVSDIGVFEYSKVVA